ncbi:MAG: 2-deoxy-D-gluconate 3-dehydrogenase, partial [Rhodoferax sp.]|nr:2-deoxy-D-gluconate 3-dehydrogenase [Rhodoferax sp.]
MIDGLDFFSDRQVLVVGGSSGIGAGIGAAFKALGAVVTVTGATAAEVQRARSDPELAGIDVVQLDVRSDAAVTERITA